MLREARGKGGTLQDLPPGCVREIWPDLKLQSQSLELSAFPGESLELNAVPSKSLDLSAFPSKSLELNAFPNKSLELSAFPSKSFGSCSIFSLASHPKRRTEIIEPDTLISFCVNLISF